MEADRRATDVSVNFSDRSDMRAMRLRQSFEPNVIIPSHMNNILESGKRECGRAGRENGVAAEDYAETERGSFFF